MYVFTSCIWKPPQFHTFLLAKSNGKHSQVYCWKYEHDHCGMVTVVLPRWCNHCGFTFDTLEAYICKTHSSSAVNTANTMLTKWHLVVRITTVTWACLSHTLIKPFVTWFKLCMICVQIAARSNKWAQQV